MRRVFTLLIFTMFTSLPLWGLVDMPSSEFCDKCLNQTKLNIKPQNYEQFRNIFAYKILPKHSNIGRTMTLVFNEGTEIAIYRHGTTHSNTDKNAKNSKFWILFMNIKVQPNGVYNIVLNMDTPEESTALMQTIEKFFKNKNK